MITNQCIKFHSDHDKKNIAERISVQKSSELILADWKTVLDNASREQEIQNYLERHPALVPGILDLHNGPLHGIIVSKFPFGADYRCDFAFVTRHSMALQFTFVEIEDPKKLIFNKDGSFSQSFNQARQQIADWNIWAKTNIHTLVDMFSPMFETYNAWNDYKDFRFYLVYGRRNEVETDKKRKDRWSSLHISGDRKTFIMSYDRIYLFTEMIDKLIVCTYKERRFYAKSDVV
jgi:hypothetical protein